MYVDAVHLLLRELPFPHSPKRNQNTTAQLYLRTPFYCFFSPPSPGGSRGRVWTAVFLQKPGCWPWKGFPGPRGRPDPKHRPFPGRIFDL